MAPRVLRRPAAHARPRSRVVARPRSRASPRTLSVLLVDTNQTEEHNTHRVFLDVIGGLLTLSVYGVRILPATRGKRAVYHAQVEVSTEEELGGTGLNGTILEAHFVKWVRRPQFEAIASQMGGFPWT